MIRRTVLTRAAALALAAVLLPSLAPTSAMAYGKEQRVRFAKGRTSATLEGTLPTETAEYDAYIVGARGGQTITVSLATDDPQAYLQIYALELGPGEDQITAEGPVRDFSGRLPVDGDYSVQVYSDGSGGPYRLEISIR